MGKALKNHLIIPLHAARRRSKAYKFDVVQYEFIPHVTLQTIAFSAIQSKRLNPQYFEKTAAKAWNSKECKLKILDLSIRVV